MIAAIRFNSEAKAINAAINVVVNCERLLARPPVSRISMYKMDTPIVPNAIDARTCRIHTKMVDPRCHPLNRAAGKYFFIVDKARHSGNNGIKNRIISRMK